jgi:2-(1,2-epoxy-1,2-dihydrophenyl)acetyl-CoA isomerase
MTELLCDIADGVATLTMNRPQARNALDTAMKDAFAEAVPRLAGDDAVRAVVLTGAGGAFCAGGDVRGMAAVRATMTLEGWEARMREFHPWLIQLIELEKPVIAAVDGPAYGAGFGLALAADLVVASPRARFCLSFMRVGLGPDFGSVDTLPRIVGVQRAKELMLSAREVGADEALALGLVLEIQPEAQLLGRAQALARRFRDASPEAVRFIKQDVAVSLASSLPEMLDREARHQARCFDNAYQAEAAERFLAKQPPRFRGLADAG